MGILFVWAIMPVRVGFFELKSDLIFWCCYLFFYICNLIFGLLYYPWEKKSMKKFYYNQGGKDIALHYF